jgi:uncharacterized protein
MVGRAADQRVTAAASRQQWRSVVFLHYRADAGVLARLLPRGLRPHLLEGEAWAGRPLDIPYRRRVAEFEERPDGVRYRFAETSDGAAASPLEDCGGTARSREDGAPEHALEVRSGELIRVHSAQDVFLTGRWNAFTAPRGRLLRFPVHHPPWPLHAARAGGSMLDLVRDWALPVRDEPPIIQYSPGVDVRLAWPRPSR